jgi:hypothetical protein
MRAGPSHDAGRGRDLTRSLSSDALYGHRRLVRPADCHLGPGMPGSPRDRDWSTDRRTRLDCRHRGRRRNVLRPFRVINGNRERARGGAACILESNSHRCARVVEIAGTSHGFRIRQYDAHHCAGRWFYPRRCRSGYGCRGRSRCSGRRLRRRWRLGLPTSENGQEGNCNALDSQGIVHQISPVSFLAQPRCRLCSGRSRQEELLGGCDFDSKPHGWARAAPARG